MLIPSLLVVIKYIAWVDTRGEVETGTKGGMVENGQLIGGMGLV
jgi:hypothetical protein